MNKKKLMMIPIILVILTLAISAYAAEPSEPHDANAIWIEPSSVVPPSTTVGTLFNVTVWANCSVNCGGWQIWLVYSNAHLNATQAGYTNGTKSEFFSSINTIPVAPTFTPSSPNASYNRVAFGESWAGTGPLRSPGSGSLCWITFNITSTNDLAEPLTFYGYTGTTRRTYLINGDTEAKVDLNIYPATVVPEFSSGILAIIMLLSLAMFISLKLTRKVK
jgi:hypothetical protein